MKYALIAAGLATSAFAQGVTEDISPKASPPDGCETSYSGDFEISARSFAAAKRGLEKRECSGEGALVLSLDGSVLLDSKDRTGYIADNYQFQFDGPAQTGAIYTAGFSACGNGSLALGGSTVFYQCLSGSFYNLYDRHWAEQCEPVLLQIVPCGGGGSGGGGGGGGGEVITTTIINQIPDGQPQAVPTVVTQIGDGQIQAPTDVVTQIDDGQIQVPPSAPPISQIDDGQIQAPTETAAPPPVTQIDDGQIQAPSEAPPPPVTQIDDGQIQAPTETAAPPPPPVTQIDDGQIQAPTEAAPPPVTQIDDGQIQAPTEAAPPPVTQIDDGQIQAPTEPAPPVTQISDGQIQAPVSSAPPPVVSPPPAEVTTPAPIPEGVAPRALPGTLGAFAVAMIGFVLYL